MLDPQADLQSNMEKDREVPRSTWLAPLVVSITCSVGKDIHPSLGLVYSNFPHMPNVHFS